MTYANIKLKTHKIRDENGNQIDQEPKIFEFMQPLVEALALKYPQWEFVEDGARIQHGLGREVHFAADKFKIMERREELGTIAVDHWCRAGRRYWVENFRINEKRERGSGFKTKHMDKALKHVVKFFGTRNTAELAASAEERASNVKRNLLYALQSEQQRKWGCLDDHAADFLMENWQAFADYMKAFVDYRKPIAGNGLLEVVEKFPDAYRHHVEANKINDLIIRGKAWLVHIVNNDYIVKQGDTVSIWESDKLPNIVRRNLGMLKLVQDRELISNVGIRVDESTYYVIGEQ